MLTEEIKSLLNKSIQALSKDRCEGRGIIRAKVTAIKVLGDNAKYRERSLKQSIGRNVHLKEISEKFEQGNLWCVLTFDCRKGYEKAKKVRIKEGRLLTSQANIKRKLNSITR